MEWPTGRITDMRGRGFDKLDALLNAIALARINLVSYEPWTQGKVTWLLGTDLRLEVEIPREY